MSSGHEAPAGPDLRAGIKVGDLPDGKMLAGQVEGEAVLLEVLKTGGADPALASVRARLSKLYEKLGRPEEAAKYAEKLPGS